MQYLSKLRDVIQNKNNLMILVSLLFACGILSYFHNCAVLLATIITLLLICFLIFNIFSIRKVFILVLVFYFGFFLTSIRCKTYDDLVILAPTKATFIGEVEETPIIADNEKIKFKYKVYSVNEKTIQANTLLSISGDINELKKINIGDKLKVKGNLREPFRSTNPSQFDYSLYLKNYNIFTTLYATVDNTEIISTKFSIKWRFFRKLNTIRSNIISVHSKFLKTPYLEILGGIVFGDDAVTPPSFIKNSFINSGLLHVLAASGMNVAFIFSFWYTILGFFKIPYKPKVLSGMFVVILYTLMTGLGPSVIRAALMLLFVLLGKLISRDSKSINLLFFVAILMLIFNPAYINDISFQLSFCVTFGLLLMVNIFSEKIKIAPEWLKIMILIPIIAQLWVIPIQMFYFNALSLYSIPANLITSIIISGLSFGGFVSSILAAIPHVSDISCSILDFLLNYLLHFLVFVSDFFGNLKYSLIQTIRPDISQIIVYYVTLIVLTLLIKHNQYKKALLIFTVITVFLVGTSFKLTSKDLEIITFDVQNADSFLIKTPQNKYFMIDTGKMPYEGGSSQAKIIMLKYLKDRGIKNIEGVIVTHFDNDHSGGTTDVIKGTNTATLYLNSKSAETQTAQNIFRTAHEIKQKCVIVNKDNEIYKEDNFSIKLLRGHFYGKNDSNSNSIVTLVTFNDFNILFMGDAGIKTFNQIKNKLPKNIEVLKVGHHGASDVVNKRMLDDINNTISIISTGVNYYGHPNKGTLDILRNTKILRTDLLHSIKITTDGHKYKIYSYNTNIKDYIFREEFTSR